MALPIRSAASARLVGAACLATGLVVGAMLPRDSESPPSHNQAPASTIYVDATGGQVLWCQEDEVAAVKVDTDPSHGLTWECVNAEEYVTEFYK